MFFSVLRMNTKRKPRRIVCYTKSQVENAKKELENYRRIKKIRRVRKQEFQISKTQNQQYRNEIKARKREIRETQKVEIN